MFNNFGVKMFRSDSNIDKEYIKLWDIIPYLADTELTNIEYPCTDTNMLFAIRNSSINLSIGLTLYRHRSIPAWFYLMAFPIQYSISF